MIYINELKHTIEKFSENNDFDKEVKSLKDVYQIFECLYENGKNGDAYSLRILNYIHSNLCDESRIKRKVTARDFEDLVASIIDGIVLDEEPRTNNKEENKDGFENYISSNYREKADILFASTGYKLSIKSLTTDNDEINCGSFAREALFNGVLDSVNYGSERKGGLGSKGQFHSTLKKIEHEKIDKFKSNFNTMVDGIFKDDIIFFMKDSNFLNIYFLEAKSFNLILKESLELNFETFVSVVNRYEGNSIRTERDVFLARCISDESSYHINIDFNAINHKIFSKVDSVLLDTKDKLTDAMYNDESLDGVKSVINNLSLKELTTNSVVNEQENYFHKQLLNLLDKGYFNLGPVIFNIAQKKEKKYSTSIKYLNEEYVEFKIFSSTKDILLDTSNLDKFKVDKNVFFNLKQVESPYNAKKKIHIIYSSDYNVKIILASGFTKTFKSILVFEGTVYIFDNENKLIEEEKFKDNRIDLSKVLNLIDK